MILFLFQNQEEFVLGACDTSILLHSTDYITSDGSFYWNIVRLDENGHTHSLNTAAVDQHDPD